MQKQFKSLCQRRNLWVGGKVATTQDLVALFIARCVELYLKHEGKFAFIAPRSLLNGIQYGGFRAGRWVPKLDTLDGRGVLASFDTSYDLERIAPNLFPVPSCVVRGQRTGAIRELNGDTIILSGKLPSNAVTLEVAAQYITETPGHVRAKRASTAAKSPYAPTVFQGATIVPSVLTRVVDRPPGPLGVPASRRLVRSRKSNLEKKPWKDLERLEGSVEKACVHTLQLGETVLPFGRRHRYLLSYRSLTGK